MIRHLTSENIDKKKWDECIQNSINGLIYAYSWYLDIVSPAWEALIEDNYAAVFPLTIKEKGGIKYFSQPFFAQQLGIFSHNILSEYQIKIFIESIPQDIRFIEININKFNKSSGNFVLKSNLNHELDLINSYESISSNYSENMRRNLKKAKQYNTQIIKNIKPDDIIDMFKSNKGKQIQIFRDNQYKDLLRLMYLSLFKNMGKAYGAYNEHNQLIAGAFFLVDQKRSIFLFSANSKQGKEKYAMVLLLDTYIRENSEKNHILDFEGSNDLNLARFYKGFGSKPCYYYQLSLNKLNPLTNILVLFIKFLRKSFRKLRLF